MITLNFFTCINNLSILCCSVSDRENRVFIKKRGLFLSGLKQKRKWKKTSFFPMAINCNRKFAQTPFKKRCRQCFQKKIMNLKSRDITAWFRLKVYSPVSFRAKDNWKRCDVIIIMSEINAERSSAVSAFVQNGEDWILLKKAKGIQNKNNAYLGGKKEVMDQMTQYKCHLTWGKNMIRQIVKIIFVKS